MFSKFTSLIVTALVVSGGLAAPASNSPQAREKEATAEVQVCTADFQGCVTIPVNSPSCIDFTEGLSFLDDESSSAVIPDGFVCTFYDNFGCLSAPGGADVVVLQGGSWLFTGAVTGTRGTVTFNDRTSSILCSPV